MNLEKKNINFSFSKNQINETNKCYKKNLAIFKQLGLDHIEARKHIIKCINNKPIKILEIGCGKGTLTTLLTQLTSEKIFVIDIDPDSLKLAALNAQFENKLNKINFYELDAKSLPFDDNSFDLVISSFSFHHFDAPFEVLSEMIRLTKENIIISDFNKYAFDIINLAHKKANKTHTRKNGQYFDIVGKYLQENNFLVTEKKDRLQKIFVATKKR